MQDCDALVSGSSSIKQFPTETQVLADLALFKLKSDPNTMANARPIAREPVSSCTANSILQEVYFIILQYMITDC
jgi:hypothetical protein